MMYLPHTKAAVGRKLHMPQINKGVLHTCTTCKIRDGLVNIRSQQTEDDNHHKRYHDMQQPFQTVEHTKW